MGAKPSSFTSALLLFCALPLIASAGEPLRDTAVVWYEDPGAPTARPVERDPNLLWDMANDTVFLPLRRFTDPGRLLRGLVGESVGPAANVNTLDEAVNSSWFTNRIGLFPLSPAEAAQGPGAGVGPDPAGPWTVIAAKTQGVTPGFTIRDAAGGGYLIKFDPPGYLGMTSAAGAISARILHAAGYNVPDDNVVVFPRERLVLGEGVKLKAADGSRRDMSEADLDAILAAVEKLPDGRILAIASKWVAGKPIGPFNYRGRRKDDPNDGIAHQHRRELRGLRFFAAWLNHFDTKQHNSLDSWIPLEESPERGFVRHYLIDFASTLGLGASGPAPVLGREYGFDLPAFAKRTAGLGLYEDPWRDLEPVPEAPQLGYWTAANFDPWAFRSQQPNSAFAHCTQRDAYWAAKIISAFTDAHLATIVAAGRYADPRVAAIVLRVLGERRDIIARRAFDVTPPLDFFSRADDLIIWRDLGAERGTYPLATSRYRARLATLDVEGGIVARSDWLDLQGTHVTLSALPGFAAGHAGAPPFFSVECQVDRGAGWSESVTALYARASGRIIELKR